MDFRTPKTTLLWLRQHKTARSKLSCNTTQITSLVQRLTRTAGILAVTSCVNGEYTISWTATGFFPKSASRSTVFYWADADGQLLTHDEELCRASHQHSAAELAAMLEHVQAAFAAVLASGGEGWIEATPKVSHLNSVHDFVFTRKKCKPPRAQTKYMIEAPFELWNEQLGGIIKVVYPSVLVARTMLYPMHLSAIVRHLKQEEPAE